MVQMFLSVVNRPPRLSGHSVSTHLEVSARQDCLRTKHYDGGLNTLRPRQNGRHFADNIFKCIFLNENEWILPRSSLKFVAKVRINNIPALVEIMAWRRSGDKPLSEPMLVRLLTHICVNRPQWVKMAKIVKDIFLKEIFFILIQTSRQCVT